MGFCNILITYFKLSVYFYSCRWICSIYGYINITHSLGWHHLPCRFKQKFLSLTGLSHPLRMIRPLYGLGKFELLFLWWFCPLYGLVKYKLFQDEFVHFMDFISFWSSSWMKLSSYGHVILARVVEPICFVDLRLNLSTFMDLIFFKSPSWMNLSFFFFFFF